MMPVPVLTLAAVLFAIGAVGTAVRRSPLVNLLSLVVMGQSAVVTLLACATYYGRPNGHVFALICELIIVIHVAIALPLALEEGPVAEVEAGDGVDVP